MNTEEARLRPCNKATLFPSLEEEGSGYLALLLTNLTVTTFGAITEGWFSNRRVFVALNARESSLIMAKFFTVARPSIFQTMII